MDGETKNAKSAKMQLCVYEQHCHWPNVHHMMNHTMASAMYVDDISETTTYL